MTFFQNPQVIFVFSKIHKLFLFVFFVYYNYTYTFDQHSGIPTPGLAG